MVSEKKYLIITLIIALAIGILFSFVNYAGREGFNPSDDGVILAQSWRILHGEVPHKDFIAMKPALSGFLHTIHFFSPLALEDSARWFVIFQNFLISFLWVFILLRAFRGQPVKTDRIYIREYIAVSLLAFTLNLNHHGLFPWTTVDGLFWSIISAALFISQYEESSSLTRKSFMAAGGIFFMSLAFLSRQTFCFALLLIDILVLFRYFRIKKYLHLLLILLIGQLPIIIYVIYLSGNNALLLFLSQISGRTELFQVGFLQYLKSFLKSHLILINLPIIFYLFWFVIRNVQHLSQAGSTFLKTLLEKYSLLVSVLALIWLVLCLSLSLNMLILFDPMNQANPFELFFQMLSILLFALIILPLSIKQRVLLIFGLVLCWTSSLSLGSNSPVYCLGLVIAITIALSLYLLAIVKSEISQMMLQKSAKLLLPISIFIFILGIWMQSRINYRERPAQELTCKLGDLMPQMGRTRSNPNLCAYYTEFLKIYNSLPLMKDHFLLLPNNAMIYPLMKSHNPFPIDWAQHDEYIGQETRVTEMIRHVLKDEQLYILIDKYNVESIAYSLFAVDYLHQSANPQYDLFLKKYRVTKYDYMPMILEYCEEVPANYTFFRLYVTKSKNHSINR
jgi:hypothetical protein